MPVSQNFNDTQVSVADKSYKLLTKTIGDMLLEVSSDFSLAGVVSDTSTEYSARYRIRETPLYLYISGISSSSSSYVRLTLQYLSGTAYVTLSDPMIRVGYSLTGSVYLAYASMGDFLGSIALSTSAGYHIYLHWGWFLSQETGEKIYCSSYADNQSGTLGPGNLGEGFAPFSDYRGQLISSLTTCLPGASAISNITTSYMSYGSSATAPTGAVAVFNPQHYIGYITGSRWFGRILWGGLYMLYILCNASGQHYIVSPGVSYAINGSTVQAVFSNIIVPTTPQ